MKIVCLFVFSFLMASTQARAVQAKEEITVLTGHHFKEGFVLKQDSYKSRPLLTVSRVFNAKLAKSQVVSSDHFQELRKELFRIKSHLDQYASKSIDACKSEIMVGFSAKNLRIYCLDRLSKENQVVVDKWLADVRTSVDPYDK